MMSVSGAFGKYDVRGFAAHTPRWCAPIACGNTSHISNDGYEVRCERDAKSQRYRGDCI